MFCHYLLQFTNSLFVELLQFEICYSNQILCFICLQVCQLKHYTNSYMSISSFLDCVIWWDVINVRNFETLANCLQYNTVLQLGRPKWNSLFNHQEDTLSFLQFFMLVFYDVKFAKTVISYFFWSMT